MRKKQFNSLYIHVPFCRKKCKYCDFFSGDFLHLIPAYRKALFKEFSLYRPELSQFPTVYFGGGTPSLMEPAFFESILSKVGQFSEVTVEFNPEDAEKEKLRELSLIGVNRISLGIQSFSERTLKTLGRRQTLKDNLKAIETVCSVFSNVSADFIYGVPGQTVESFLKDLETALSFPIKHVSLYALTVYEETSLFKELSDGKFKLPEEEIVYEIYSEAISFLENRGFRQYEISNFAVPGFESKHNINYWKIENYLGLGPSAASFCVNKYWKNVSNIKEYVEKVERGELPIQEEEIFEGEELKKLKLIMGLRLTEGVDLKEISLEEKFRRALKESEILKGLMEERLIETEKNRLRLGKKGLFVSNSIISQLINVLF